MRVWLLRKIRRNWIDRRVEGEKIGLKDEIKELRKEINEIDKKIMKKFEDGIGADEIKKEIIASDIVGLYMEA